jgi:hypothetical protein
MTNDRSPTFSKHSIIPVVSGSEPELMLYHGVDNDGVGGGEAPQGII